MGASMHLLRQLGVAPVLDRALEVAGQEDGQEGRDQVVDALHVPAGWVPAWEEASFLCGHPRQLSDTWHGFHVSTCACEGPCGIKHVLRLQQDACH